MIGVAYYSKIGKELGSKEYSLLGLSELAVASITKDIIIDSNESCVEWKSLGINDWDSKVIKEKLIFEYKYNIIDGDKLLTTEGSPELIYDGIRVDNSGGKSDGFPVEASYGATLRFSDSSILDVADSSKLNILCL